jgi:hypothetical protein
MKKTQEPTKQQIATALTWAKGDISLRDAARRLKRTDVGVYMVIARSLKAHLKLWEK